MALNDTFYIKGEESVVLEMLKFYISGIAFWMNDSLVWQESQSYHLYDLSDVRPIVLQLPPHIRYNRLSFHLGIDSITNVSGAMGGDLDPIKGMYWTWQSGYINFKMEGKSSVSVHPKKEFQLHLGGYQFPYNTLQTISLPVNSAKQTEVLFDVKLFLSASDLSRHHHIMSPGPAAIELSATSVYCFSIKP